MPKLSNQEILDDLRAAPYIDALRIPPTSPRFTILLQDREFAAQALIIVSEKMVALEDPSTLFPSKTGRENTLSGWQRLLAKIKDSLYQDGIKR